MKKITLAVIALSAQLAFAAAVPVDQSDYRAGAVTAAVEGIEAMYGGKLCVRRQAWQHHTEAFLRVRLLSFPGCSVATWRPRLNSAVKLSALSNLVDARDQMGDQHM